MGGQGSGGARTQSGPAPDPKSARSISRGFTLRTLPPEGYTGAIPEFPLPAAGGTEPPPNMPLDTFIAQQARYEDIHAREIEVWERLWRTPQAEIWAKHEWIWPTIGHYARIEVRCEDPEAKPTLFAHRNRLGDQIGLTPAGLRQLGWEIGSDSQTDPDVAGTKREKPRSKDRAAKLARIK